MAKNWRFGDSKNLNHTVQKEKIYEGQELVQIIYGSFIPESYKWAHEVDAIFVCFSLSHSLLLFK